MIETDGNTTKICLEAFKFTDMGQYIKGTGQQQTGFSLGEWAYGQSPLATVIGLCCLILRFFDTRLAAGIAWVKKIELRAYQKVNNTNNSVKI